MKPYILSCESTVDLTREVLERRQISYICYPYELDGKLYFDDFGETVPYEAFYHAMEEGADTRTAQINTFEFECYFEPFLKDGYDVVHLCLSSGITGVMNAAQMTKSNLEARYPGQHIYLVDSLAASSGFGLLVDRLADLRDNGASAEELARWAEENRLRVHHWFFSGDLRYYVRGGRISKTEGAVGTLLGICPLLNVSSEGRLVPREKLRGRTRAVKAIVDRMARYAENRTAYSGKCYVSYSGTAETAKEVAELILERFPKVESVELYHIGTIIGSHSGPGTVALFFWGEPREN